MKETTVRTYNSPEAMSNGNRQLADLGWSVVAVEHSRSSNNTGSCLIIVLAVTIVGLLLLPFLLLTRSDTFTVSYERSDEARMEVARRANQRLSDVADAKRREEAAAEARRRARIESQRQKRAWRLAHPAAVHNEDVHRILIALAVLLVAWSVVATFVIFAVLLPALSA